MDWKSIDISVDLIRAARRHLHFLDNVDNIERILTNDDLLQLSIRRYEQLWIPLVYEHRSEQLVPPIDIAWMWYCHMLNPLAYRKDCRLLLQKTLNHEYVRTRDVIGSTNTAIELWYEKYPKDGFNIIRNGEIVVPSKQIGKLTDAATRLSVNLVETAKSQMHFCYQVALPHFRDKKFLETALKRYKQFLCLKKLNEGEFLVPPVDIILMWFTHMCHPIEYATDTVRACGRVLENNIRVSIGYVTDTYRSFSQETIRKWSSVDKEDLVQPGTKLRARDTRKEVNEMGIKDIKSCCIVAYKLNFLQAELVGFPAKMRRQFQVRLQLQKSGSSVDEVLILSATKRQKLWNVKTMVSYTTNVHCGIRAALNEDINLVCCTVQNPISSGTYNISPILERMEPDEKNFLFDIPMTSHQETRMSGKQYVQIDVKVEHAQPLTCNLTLLQTEEGFTDRILEAEELLKMFCRSTLADNRKSHRCFSKTSKLQNHEGRQDFHCTVVHIPEQLLSGVQVFFKDKLMVTSYVIGSSQLPLPSQVVRSDLSMAFDPDNGDRAMLIRNGTGDWGVCIGRWIKDDEDEFLKIKFMRLSKIKLKILEVNTVDINFQNFSASLRTGAISIDPTYNAICENIALVFSISILHALCSPEQPERRIKSILAPAQDSNPARDGLSAAVVSSVPEADCVLLLAAGLQTSTPNNQYILQKYGSLSVDLKFDAQDIYIDEVKMDKSMYSTESKLTECDIDDRPKKPKTEKVSHISALQNNDNKSDETEKIEKLQETKTNSNKAVKRKRIRKRKSTKLEDEMCPSDDSLDLDVKEAAQFLQKNGNADAIVVESAATEKLLKKKKSSTLAEELSPSEDSLDEAEKEWKEFQGDSETNTNVPEEQNMMVNGGATYQKADAPNIQNEIEKQDSKDEMVKEEPMYPQSNQSKVDPNQSVQDKENVTLHMTNINQNDKTKKESKKERRKRLARANAEMIPGGSSDSDSLTPVEPDVAKGRKRRPIFNKGDENNIIDVKNNDSVIEEKAKKVTFY